ncbi:amidohydrolase family protein [Phaeobacter gallaeciensis]|jgi:predicted TIM-barrel fold metal-dependent hydrolase|uniref:Amidohydrolase family protein n=1 Tax=Phaeobacter gallaeciensis TaxID=60890 RepID=A0ABD4XFC1_9RHOB|nr:amidohydrolase family protein [Phaeobacter gallaeciensis]MDE4142229.1 amidohydrolase family protein [Phaeobacter gallaeciensis]MDE4146575.1 amidohydrolase family protein [Phaeobacter gallaeciensis]MDE4150648.1 amidohydrolase family protein [Phaeobacter gallaeciensis]MDE4154827.1 amidohydrolase family protein [Phaeobacter gallaeciensis]MDE4159283.1 amidohydrolase family protein [Phaeobacter gallaeciensis]
MKKRLHGREEPIFEPDLPIIDAHHHMFDRPGARYLLDEISEDIGLGHKVCATVYIESRAMMRADGPELTRPAGETEFANGIAAMSASGTYGPFRVNAAIVGFADFTLGAQVAQTLEAHMAAAPDRFRGIRQVTLWHPDPAPNKFMFDPPSPGLMASDRFKQGFAELARRGLSFDAAVFHTQLPELAELADRFPDTPIILNHLGFAMGMGLDPVQRTEVFNLWRENLRQLAKRPNIAAKIGGFGMPFWAFGFDEAEGEAASDQLAKVWRPYALEGIEIFGPDRCMMESNFPADGHSCGYVPLWNALKKITASFSVNEKSRLYWDTAARLYRLKLPKP